MIGRPSRKFCLYLIYEPITIICYSKRSKKKKKSKKEKSKFNKMEVDRTNEIRWNYDNNNYDPNRPQFQDRMNPDPQYRQNEPRHIDPNVNRRVKLQQLELQSNLEKRSAEDHLRMMQNREIGQKDERYYEAK